MKRRLWKALAVAGILGLCTVEPGWAGMHKITVDANQTLGQVNRKLFGNNFLGYDPLTVKFSDQSYPGHMNYGEGLWDPVNRQPVQTTVDLARAAGITTVRFPGGCGSHQYNWKETVGKNRQAYLFGIDEFLQVTRAIGAEPVFTLSYFTGDENDAADLAEYLNSPSDGSNPNGGVDWAARRAENGHPDPYGVKYFEMGNEIWHGNHQEVMQVAYHDYGQNFVKYAQAMRGVDPGVQLGMALFTYDWNEQVLDIIKDHVSFGIIHTYPSPEVSADELAKMSATDIFKVTYFRPLALDQNYYRVCLNALRQKTGRDIPLVISEYNGGFVQDRPVPYRHSLGTALLNAEMLRLFMKPEHNVLMAHYWNFTNEYWGMVGTPEDFMSKSYGEPISYVKRPSYYVYDLYKNHFGDTLLNTTVLSDTYTISPAAYAPIDVILRIFVGPEAALDPQFTGGVTMPVPYLTVNASKSADGRKLFLMVINRHPDQKISASFDLRNFPASRQVKYWILNGPALNSTNENGTSVQIKSGTQTYLRAPTSFSFPAHSLTALEILRK